MLSAYAKALTLIQLIWPLYRILATNIEIEDFHAHSFVPKEIILEYSIDNGDAINFNLSVRNQFPGKILMHIFVRQLANVPGGHWSNELIKLKNMDFCHTLESLRNLTTEQTQSDSIIPQTFLISCPLKPGFYYVSNGKFDIRVLPINIPNGRYLVQFELIQVYEEVIKLLSCKIKCKKQTPIDNDDGEKNQTFNWSDEEEDKDQENIETNQFVNKTEIIPTKKSNEDERHETEIDVEMGSGEVQNDDENKEEDEQEEPEEPEKEPEKEPNNGDQESDSKMEY